MTANRISGNSEAIEDLRRLCLVFEHVDKLLTLAASLHRKFIQAPRLSEAIFTDYYNFYLPRMGTGTVDGNQRVSYLYAMKSVYCWWCSTLIYLVLQFKHQTNLRELAPWIFFMRSV